MKKLKNKIGGGTILINKVCTTSRNLGRNGGYIISNLRDTE